MDIQVEIVEIGTFVTFEGNSYVVLQTTTYQEEKGQFATKAKILQVSDEGDDLGKEPITVNTDYITEI